MREELLTFAVNGTPGTGFLIRPDDDMPKAAVVVVQEWWGLNEHIKDIARRFAAEGFIALAPDLYHGKIVSEPNEAQKEAMGLDRDRAIKEISSAVNFLKGQSYVVPEQIVLIGFCMGGGLAILSTLANPAVRAVASFYGGGMSAAPEDFKDNKAAILNVVGEKDEWVTGAMKTLDAKFTELGYTFPHQIVVYPGAQHAFFNDTRPEVHDSLAASDAWARTLAWFREHMA